MGEKFKFSKDGFWLELRVMDDNRLHIDTNKDRRQWPEEGCIFYAKVLLDYTVKCGDSLDEITRRANFFEAKGFRYKKRLYKELFRMPWGEYSEEDLKYIKETEQEAEKFFSNAFNNAAPNIVEDNMEERCSTEIYLDEEKKSENELLFLNPMEIVYENKQLDLFKDYFEGAAT
ncbi:hypothetical protein P4679_24340 [Priestia megaterium]|uniref:hypothetical protein n=1 Tax=Priestia megaterium TaxID=1404 RepID=UPI002E1FBAA2|nr:hypothetical protein [Priestia megaterium]